MVGYGGSLAANSVPEWRAKYLRYEQLSSLLEKLPRYHHANESYIASSLEAKDIAKYFRPGSKKHDLTAPDAVASCEDDSARRLVCVPITEEIAINLKHASELTLNIDVWGFGWEESEVEMVPPLEKEFFHVLNADTRIIAAFQFRIFCQCLEELFNLNQHAILLIGDSNSARDGPAPLHPRRKSLSTRIKNRAAAALKEESLLKGYEQLYKLVNLLLLYMNDNRIGMEKIIKKHCKHSMYSNSKKILKKAILNGHLPKSQDGTSANSKPRMPAIFDVGRIDKELVKAIESSYYKVKQFQNSDLSKHDALSELRTGSGIHKKFLRPNLFFPGLFMGMSIPLTFYSLSVIIGDRNIHGSYHWKLGWIHFRLCFLITWQIFLWGIDLWVFNKFHINHVLIFDLRGGSDMQYDAMLSTATFFFLAVFSGFTLFVKSLVSSLLDSSSHPSELDAFDWMDSPGSDFLYWPRNLVIFVLVMLLMPLPLNFWKTRRWLLLQLWRMATVPFREVDWPMFFLADQLCSHVRTIKDFIIVLSYLFVMRGEEEVLEFLTPGNTTLLDLAAGLLPLTIRVIQCGRRYYDMKRLSPLARNTHHLNALKYASSMLVVISSAYGLTGLWVASAIVATAYSFWWDIIMDWGLGDPKRGYLRKDLIFSTNQRGSFYYVAIVLNLVMRCAWVLSISPGAVGIKLRDDVLVFCMALVELVRRALWNVLRLENEQFHNTGEWRAVKHVSVELSNSILLSPAVLVSSTLSAFRSTLLSSQVHSRASSESPHRRSRRHSRTPSEDGLASGHESSSTRPARDGSPFRLLHALRPMQRARSEGGGKIDGVAFGKRGDEHDGVPMLEAAAAEDFHTAVPADE